MYIYIYRERERTKTSNTIHVVHAIYDMYNVHIQMHGGNMNKEQRFTQL